MSATMWWAVAAVAALALIAALVDGRARSGRPVRRRAAKRSGTVPARGEVWWASVPYEDRPGAKDRPCLVLSVRGRTARVAKITSRSHAELPGVFALPAGTIDDPAGRQSYLQSTELREVPLPDFRRRAGALDPRFMRQLDLS
jgi:mRNA-degrading endonuclease toxin of MazEF toxin-antitoxin module